jgi:hypothetical protein
MKIKLEFPKDSPKVKVEFEIPPEILEAIRQKIPLQLIIEEDKKED